MQAAAAAATMDCSTPTGDALAAATGCVWPVVARRALGGSVRKQVRKELGGREQEEKEFMFMVYFCLVSILAFE